MKYLLLIYRDQTVQLTPEQRSAIPERVGAWIEEMDSRGVRLQGHPPAPVNEAANVRVRNGNVAVREGPVVEVEPHISGFNILDCADLDEALEVASENPVARFGMLELRAFAD